MASSKEKVIVYYSTIRGITEQKTNEPTVYFGIVSRVPSKDVGDPNQFQHEVEPNEIMDKLSQLKGIKPVPGGVWERYEVFDVDTGDMLMMYRVPCREEEEVGH